MIGRTDEVAGDVGGDNRRPLEEVNRRHLEEEKPRLLQQQKLTAAGDGRSPAAGDSQFRGSAMVRKVSASRIEDSSSPSESSSSTSSDGSTGSETVVRVSTEADLSVSAGKLTAVAKRRMEGKGKGVNTASKKKRRLLSSGVSILPAGTSRTERPPTAPRSTRSVGEVTVSRVGNEPLTAIPLERPSTDRPLEPVISLDPEDPGREGPPTYYANPQEEAYVPQFYGDLCAPGGDLRDPGGHLCGPGGDLCAPFSWRLGAPGGGLRAPGGDLCAPFLWRLMCSRRRLMCSISMETCVLPEEAYVLPEEAYVLPEETYVLHFYGDLMLPEETLLHFIIHTHLIALPFREFTIPITR
ncbi:hypothetical protein LWI29_025192 [Acer saccharum]|uniref:Uncharacterized protein n=1 Tax=Acer saccharum TaxID=4024 RepID=A0AA39RDS6_ACESA|nr:hypothetical protein LWI29_025192 [Acer saccharum]